MVTTLLSPIESGINPEVSRNKESLFETTQKLCSLIYSARKSFNEYLNDFLEDQNRTVLEETFLENKTLGQMTFLTEENKKILRFCFLQLIAKD
jgi:hypothetical protein